VILSAPDTPTDEVPQSVDGTDEVVFLGVLPAAGSIRSIQIQMSAGQPLRIQLVVPDQAPEREMPPELLPAVVLAAPDGVLTALEADTRTVFTDPRNGQRYLVLRVFETEAVAGVYTVTVSGRAPARFAVSHGRAGATEFHGVNRAGLATVAAVADWYATTPEGSKVSHVDR
jgi:hypothetical protein